MKLSLNEQRIAAFVMAAGALFTATAPAFAEGSASSWVEGFNNKVRLLAGQAGESGKTTVFAGIEISMPPGWKTYWRAPGDAGGVPPQFDFGGSSNVADIRVLYPAPHRLIDKAGATAGYKDHVVFPVSVTVKDPTQPINLKLKAAYGVCKELCVPAEAELELQVAPDVGASDEIAAALLGVPRLIPNPATDPVISKWRVEPRGTKLFLVVDVADPGIGEGDAFIDAQGGMYLPMPKKISDADGKGIYEVDLTDGADVKELKGKPVAVTLTGLKGQSETSITLP
jgi:DsbC/DsbD-like thiol-disulfide interchange protein